MNEFIFTTDILQEFEVIPTKEYKVCAVIITFEGENYYNKDILGKKCIELVKDAVKNYEIQVVVGNKNKSLVENLCNLKLNADYVVALYGDTPLVTEENVSEAVYYATTKNLDLLRLYKGAVVKVSAIRKDIFEYVGEGNFLKKENFLSVFNEESLCRVRSLKKEEIISQLLKKGVEIVDPQTVYIECLANIEKNVKICAGNVIKGNTFIQSGTILYENNLIIDSFIEKDCKITSSYISSSKIKKGSVIKPFSIVEGKK